MRPMGGYLQSSIFGHVADDFFQPVSLLAQLDVHRFLRELTSHQELAVNFSPCLDSVRFRHCGIVVIATTQNRCKRKTTRTGDLFVPSSSALPIVAAAVLPSEICASSFPFEP